VTVEPQPRAPETSDARSAPPAFAALLSSKRARAILEIPLLLAVALVIVLLVKAFLAQAFYIPSASMEPQLRATDRVVVSRLSYRLHEPRRGDIVVFPSPAVAPPDEGFVVGLLNDVLESVALRDPGERELIKRVVGLPGELIQGKDGSVYIDGRRLVEPYLPPGTPTSDFGPIDVPEGTVFVLGDNRTNSHDSRFPDIGPIPIDSIVGRAVARVWPPGRNAFL
jgi:signal peptidase I